LHESGATRARHGLGSVYPDLRVLEATWRQIESHGTWRIPAMNRELIEHSLHTSVLREIVEASDGGWRTHAEHVDGSKFGERSLAAVNLVDWTRRYAETSFPNADDERILTRLGDGDRLVRFETPVMGPFGETFSELTLLAAWLKGVDPKLTTA